MSERLINRVEYPAGVGPHMAQNKLIVFTETMPI